MLRIEDDVRKSLFTELKHLHRDPETVLYMVQSYLNLARETVDPECAYFDLKEMLSERCRLVFADMWKWLWQVGVTNPEVFGLERNTDYVLQHNKEAVVYQMGFDGFQHMIFQRDFYDREEANCLLRISDYIYFNPELVRVDEWPNDRQG